AITDANAGHQVAYGDDVYTQKLTSVIKKQFGDKAEVFPVFNGTGANVLTLQAMCRSWESVVCATSAHINVDEGGAPEKVAGLKLMQVETPDGKLTPELIALQAWGFGNEHRAQPKVVSITNSTEMGTVYSVAEIKAIVDYAHGLGMYVHLDGARISNAAAALGVPLRAFTTDIGVDAVSLGGTKNGAMGAEAIVILNPELTDVIKYIRKTGMQLASKMRFISAQLIALFESDLWLKSASHSNAMAQALYAGIKDIPGIKVSAPQANALFPFLPADAIEPLQAVAKFYVWDHMTNQVRWMCSWDTTQADVDNFVAAVKTQLTK
ncbi:MAG: beta-eliminating lyase-related protein, partial [Actinomycetes bacterium]